MSALCNSTMAESNRTSAETPLSGRFEPRIELHALRCSRFATPGGMVVLVLEVLVFSALLLWCLSYHTKFDSEGPIRQGTAYMVMHSAQARLRGGGRGTHGFSQVSSLDEARRVRIANESTIGWRKRLGRAFGRLFRGKSRRASGRGGAETDSNEDSSFDAILPDGYGNRGSWKGSIVSSAASSRTGSAEGGARGWRGSATRPASREQSAGESLKVRKLSKGGSGLGGILQADFLQPGA